MKTKSLRVEVKDADQGRVKAVFSTMNVIDSDGDVTLPGAFTDGAPVRISAYGHASWSGALPVGKGVIHADEHQAVLDGEFFLNTTHGRDTFETVKQLGELGEWSYGFDVLDAEPGTQDGRPVQFLKRLAVHEVSPVLLGAGVNTRTLEAKGANTTFTGEAEAVLAAVTDLTDRAADVLAKRREKGKGLGAESSALLEQLDERLKALRELLSEPDPELNTGELNREFLRFLARNTAATPIR